MLKTQVAKKKDIRNLDVKLSKDIRNLDVKLSKRLD